MADLPTEPDPRTAADDLDDATNEGVSAQSPAEGDDDQPAGNDGSPQG